MCVDLAAALSAHKVVDIAAGANFNAAVVGETDRPVHCVAAASLTWRAVCVAGIQRMARSTCGAATAIRSVSGVLCCRCHAEFACRGAVGVGGGLTMDVYRHVSACCCSRCPACSSRLVCVHAQANVPEQLQDEQRFTEKVAVIDCGRRQTIAATCTARYVSCGSPRVFLSSSLCACCSQRAGVRVGQEGARHPALGFGGKRYNIDLALPPLIAGSLCAQPS
jgi:hypothetical protein